ncbi:MAG TPA: bifunctional adenosylcobinamide kinase/adenosylcobinamide-phosphate guanylyltransferase [Burkholderiaceae bacterium]|nr:bifunctional adenosylcobinamide kinase/adenosylcobinamide-phosphate guanylyltransferase [Burkholderiaceae bacterium]
MTPLIHQDHELILGGARSGKSRTAEARASAWLRGGAGREAALIATAWGGDGEMVERIRKHRVERAMRVPALATFEVPTDLPAAVLRLSAPHRLLVIDCLTLWLTQCLLPPTGRGMDTGAWQAEQDALLRALHESPGPIVLVSNEIGLGVMPLSREARACVDALGIVHQRVAAHCARITLMVAGCELAIKERR